METVVFNSIQVTNYWFTLHCALRPLYQQAQTSSPNIQGISDQDVTIVRSWYNIFFLMMLHVFHTTLMALRIKLLDNSEQSIFRSMSVMTLYNYD